MSDRVTKSIIVQGDISDIYDIWANFENFPHFMHHIKAVKKSGNDMSHWVMEGPLGKNIEWKAKTTRQEKNKRIAWNSMDNSEITTSGQVTFNALPGNQVEVTVTLQYSPPVGAVGEVVTHLFTNLDEKIGEDLRRFKKYAEGVQRSVKAGG